MVTGKIALSGIYENILGPGKRLIIWLQGCDRGCTGCQSTHFAKFLPFEDIQIKIDSLFEEAVQAECTGITISGGEPFAQSNVIDYIVSLIKAHNEECNNKIDILVYTGYTYEELLPKYQNLLRRIDVLIDGPFVNSLNDGKGLRGSSNQRMLFLTDKKEKLKPMYEDVPAIRNQVIDFVDGRFVLIGLKN